MNYIPQVVKMLNIEIGERFKVIVNGMLQKGLFHFEDNAVRSGLFEENNQDPNTAHDFNWILIALIFGEAKIKKLLWKPKENEKYYFPNVSMGIANYEYRYWLNSGLDKAYYNTGFVCCTKEEAYSKARKMLAVAKDA